jgi:amphi-Trp domain-containing protein
MARRKRTLVKSKEWQDVQHIAGFLHDLAERLGQNELILRQGDDEVQLSIPDRVVLGLKAKEKQKKRRTKQSLKLTLRWIEDEHGKEAVTFG